MREIKFRGLDRENWLWCYGGIDKDAKRIVESNSRHPFRDVYEETIGEYTRLKDKNDKEIYEGDIVKFKSCGEEYIGEVIYKKYDFLIDDCWTLYYIWEGGGIEVIGNIYENRELLN